MAEQTFGPWWSFSLLRGFRRCKREFFYDVYWGQDEHRKWRLYTMKRLRTLSAFRGIVVHDVIAGLLRKARGGGSVDEKEALACVTDSLHRGYNESSQGWWDAGLRPPGVKLKDVTCLLEHYYEFDRKRVDAEYKEQLARAQDCVRNLFGLDAWKKLLQSDPKRWRAIDCDGPLRFDLDGTQVLLKLDFACDFGSRRVVDWKTGTPSNDDRLQLVLYSLYAEKQWGWSPPTETKLTAVYLHPKASRTEFCASAEDIQGVRDLVKQSFAEMMEPVNQTGRADESLYPRNESDRTCPRCRFQGECGRESETVRELLARAAAVRGQCEVGTEDMTVDFLDAEE